MKLETVLVTLGIAVLVSTPLVSASPVDSDASDVQAMAFSVLGSAAYQASSSSGFDGQSTVWECHKFAPSDRICAGQIQLVAGKSYTPNFNTRNEEALFTGQLTFTITDTPYWYFDEETEEEVQVGPHSRTRTCYGLPGVRQASVAGMTVVPACSETGDTVFNAGPASVSVSASSASFLSSPQLGPWSYWGILLWES